MKTHHLETDPSPFAAVASGIKGFEFRRNDRGFEVGDILVLLEHIPASGTPGESSFVSARYTGAKAVRGITYVLRGPAYGVPDGFAVLSLVGGGSSGWPTNWSEW